MSRVLEQQALTQIPELLAGWFDLRPTQLKVQRNRKGVDLILRAPTTQFAIEWKAAGTIAVINAAIKELQDYLKDLPDKPIPVVAVPFMGEAGRKLCKEQGISWLDLSGNAHIVAPGLRIHVAGQPNRFTKPGRPKSLFAPKSSRIIRQLLIHANQTFTQAELSKETGVDKALVSRVVRELEKNGFVVRDEGGAVKVKDPSLLLDAWREAYSLRKHQVIEGFIAERSSDEVMHTVSRTLEGSALHYAATGLAGAWLLTHFASFRIVTFYVKARPSQELLHQLKFEPRERGGNVWLVVPNDEGVFVGADEREGIQCAHPVQVYLDLKDHPERAKEAADAVRKEYLNWLSHVG